MNQSAERLCPVGSHNSGDLSVLPFNLDDFFRHEAHALIHG